MSIKKLGRPLSSDWVSTKIAAAELGCSIGHLFNLKEDETFKHGKHFRDIRRTYGIRATYRWHLPNCAAILDLHPGRL